MATFQGYASLVKCPGKEMEDAPKQGIRKQDEQDLVAWMVEGFDVAAGGDRAGVVEDGKVRAVADRIALIEEAEGEFDLLMVHVEDLRVEAGADCRFFANRISGSAEIRGEEGVVGTLQWNWMAPALHIIGMPVRLEDTQR